MSVTYAASYAELDRSPEPCGGFPITGGLITSSGIPAVRLGHDCPCGAPFHIYRNAARFLLSGLAAPVTQAVFNLYRLLEHVGVGNILAEWVDYTGAFRNDFTLYSATALWTSPVFITPSTPLGYARVNITDAYNQAQAQKRTDLILRLRLTDESDQDCQGGTTWYAFPALSAAQQLRPYLDLTGPTSQTVTEGNLLAPQTRVLQPTLIALPSNQNVLIQSVPAKADLDFGGARSLKIVRRGNKVQLVASLVDQAQLPGQYLDGPVTLTLTGPDGVAVLTNAAMTRYAHGIYRYEYLTQGTDPLGPYTATVAYAGPPAGQSFRSVVYKLTL